MLVIQHVAELGSNLRFIAPRSNPMIGQIVGNGCPRGLRRLRCRIAMMSGTATQCAAHRDRLQRDRDSQQPDQQDTDNSEHRHTLNELAFR